MKNNILTFLAIITIISLGFLSGCKYDEILPETIDPGELISFSEDIIPIFEADCNSSGCHDAGQVPPDLSPANAYNAIIDGDYINLTTPEESEFYLWVSGGGSIPMPIEGTDPNIESAILVWIQQGALNN